jgi:glyoxylase-like metal-dependent hydrolase (beta-lactamase superfamily II)
MTDRLAQCADVLRSGDELGNHMILKLRLPSGREIFGFGTETVVTGDWALGPTWCYYVPSEPSFLLDCGWQKWGGLNLLKMMEETGIRSKDIGTVMISHGHEDHDGGLSELVDATGLRVMAHPIYERLIRRYLENTPSGARAGFSASCWNCSMPSSFSEKYCLAYHRERDRLQIEEIPRFGNPLFDGITVHHLPGHCPDAIAVMVGEEAILVGDIILPEITPHPTLESHYRMTGGILKPVYERGDQIYGLRIYIRTLKKLLEIAKQYPDILVLPAHRLFCMRRWNGLSLRDRTAELIEHHIQRCADILALLKGGPKTAKEIALEYFEPRLLRGFGILMAINEILSHSELLSISGDVTLEGDKITGTGSAKFERLIDALEPLP